MRSMVVCPLCEHAQPTGDVCDVCGRKLAGPGAEPLPIAPLEGLEPTRLDAPPSAAPSPLPGLEPTAHPAVNAALVAVPDLERGRAAPVAVVPEPLPGVERTEVEPIPGDAPTPEPVAPTCRYCRTPAAPGELLCSRCGMRLPTARGPDEAPSAESQLARCPACGTMTAGAICTGCGGLVRRP